MHLPVYADATYLFLYRSTASGIAVAIATLSSELAAGGARTDSSLVQAKLAAASPADILMQPIFNPVGGYASYVVSAALVLILQQTLLLGAALLTSGALATVLGRGVAHLTIYLPALALYFIVLPRVYDFSTLGNPLQVFAPASVFILTTSFMAQAVGAWFKRPETAILVFLATSLPQFFLTGFAWPREAIPGPVLAAEIAAEIAKAKSRLDYAEPQLSRAATLARGDFASQQALDQAQHDVETARADIAEAEANYAAAKAGPTREQRVIADAQVEAATSALTVLERRLAKTVLRAPADGVVAVIVAEVGENVRAGQPVLVIEETGKRWLSFNAREDLLHGLAVGATVDVARPGAPEPTPAVVTEVLPLGPFATWQAERAVGDHDRSTLRLRLDPQGDASEFEPGMTVWFSR
jgi:biotin carboxyl carrier protein